MALKISMISTLKFAAISSLPVASTSLFNHEPKDVSSAVSMERPSIVEVEDPDSQYPMSSDGYYYAIASSDGHNFKMLIDSGANITVLSAKDARMLGINPPHSSFREKLITANGSVRIALARINRLTLAHKEFVNLRVAVTSDDHTPSLCGSDMLSQFKAVAMVDNVLALST